MVESRAHLTFFLVISLYDVLLLVGERLISLYREVIVSVIDLARFGKMR